MVSFFNNIYKFISRRKVVSLLGLLLVVFGLVFLITKIQFEEDISKLIPASEDTQELQKILKSAKFSDKLVVNLQLEEGASFEDLTLYASQYIDSIQNTSGNYIENIQGKVDDEDVLKTLDFLYQNLPLFLETKDYEIIRNKISIDSIDAITYSNYKTLISPSGFISKDIILKDPLGLSFIALKKMQALNIGDEFIVEDGFVVTKNKKNILLFITPKLTSSETDNNSEFVDQLYEVQNALNLKFKDKVVGEYFGGVIIAVANARQIKKDIQVTVSISLTVLMIILMVFYKRLSIPIVLFVPTIIGGLLAGAFLLLLRDKISAISLGLGSVLLGITLDYSLHILTHLRNNNNVKSLYKDVAQPILMSSLTTAMAFLCLLFINSQALQDLGIFAAVSVLGASGFALVFIPHVYTASTKKINKSTVLDKVAAFSFQKSKLAIGIVVLVFLVSLFTYNKVIFNNDLTTLNFVPPALEKAEERLDDITNFSSKSIYITSFSNSTEEALITNNAVFQDLIRLKEEAIIYNYSSIGGLVFSEEIQQEKIDNWNSFWTQKLKDDVENNLISSGDKLGFKAQTFQSFYQLISKDFQSISIDDYKAIQTFFISDYLNVSNELTTITSLVKVEEENVNEIYDFFEDKDNVILIDRRKVNETFLGNLKNDFNELIKYSFITVILILLLFYRSLSLTLITSIPIAVTWLLTIGVMGLLKLEFNVFNIIISSFIFGLGIDYSIFMTNALRKDYTYGTKEINTFKISIILSVITTVLGVGVLIFAKHPAIYSMSVVSLIGILLTAFMAFTIQPLLFNVFIRDRANRGYSPIDISLFIRSCLLLLFYSLGGIILSILSLTLLQILPVSKKKKYKWMHKLVSLFTGQVLRNHYLTKKKVINDVGEDFSKPAIIIANHASSLDTLSLNSLTYNVIYMVNDWVYKSPIFGVLARVLGYYPATTGIDKGVGHLSNKLKQGYLLCIFPEGKRSFTNKIGRFHKGPFFMQQTMEIDILPIYIHGNSEVMPKGDFMIHSGKLSVKVGERIPYNSNVFGQTDREKTKRISAFYKQNFLDFRKECEGPEYYKRILFSNYKFKEPSIIRKVKEDFEINKYEYHYLNEEVPMKTKLLHLGNDYGQIDILLVSKYLDRKITNFISDPVKYVIANNAYTNKKRKVSYVSSLGDIDYSTFDSILISDSIFDPDILLANCSNAKTIIIMHNDIANEKLNDLGFQLNREKGSISIYTKQATTS